MAGEREPAAPRRSGATGAEARAGIDSGRHGDKVDFPDPAAAPLGTDAEAGGMAAASSGETRRADTVERPNDTNDASGLPLFIFGGVILLVVAIIVAVAG